MNLHSADVALNTLEVWMLLSMHLHGVDVALSEFAWCGCCSQ